MKTSTKQKNLLLSLLSFGLLSLETARAQLDIPTDGSDGVFAPTADVTIDLSQAATAAWNAPSPVSGRGVYDPEKWAVVFKYASVNIPANVVVRFKNHDSRAPVVWLVQGDVTIHGEVNLDGEGGPSAFDDGQRLAEPGPGGFRGAPGAPNGATGLGPGGGGPASQGFPAGAGTYATPGDSRTLRASTYGNSGILPLIGGSGGGAAAANRNGWGGAAGGAILIASRSSFMLEGRIYSGPGLAGGNNINRGSGGAVRLVASEIKGRGLIDVTDTRFRHDNTRRSGDGRIRLETPSYAASFVLIPRTLAVPPQNPPAIWAPENAPQARVLSVAGANVPVDPRSNLTASGSDIELSSPGEVEILVETRQMPLDATVEVIVNSLNGFALRKNATHQSGDANIATWIARVAVPEGFAAVQVRATTP